MSHSYVNLLYHFVWATKGRELLLDDEIRPALFLQLGAELKKEGCIPLEINGMADHVHVLAKLHQRHRVAEVISDIKSRSTGWVKRTFPGRQNFGWQTGYGGFTISYSNLADVRAYIANQEAHHRERTLSIEFLALCRSNGVEIDEKTMWD
jgi:REP element-mobilizing transposase RayT